MSSANWLCFPRSSASLPTDNGLPTTNWLCLTPATKVEKVESEPRSGANIGDYSGRLRLLSGASCFAQSVPGCQPGLTELGLFVQPVLGRPPPGTPNWLCLYGRRRAAPAPIGFVWRARPRRSGRQCPGSELALFRTPGSSPLETCNFTLASPSEIGFVRTTGPGRPRGWSQSADP